MVKVTIDGRDLRVDENISIMDACKALNIDIPKLCFLKDINEIGGCRVCLVEVEGMKRLVTSCNNKVFDGMVIHTNSQRVRESRKRTVQMILSQHDSSCPTCVRSGNCSLQSLANDLNIREPIYKEVLINKDWDQSFPLIRDANKCIKCMRCVQICDKVQGLNVWELEGTGGRSDINVSGNRTINEADCSLCGQCITHCPVGALRERDDTEEFFRAVYDKDKTVIVQVAPAVRAAFAEETGISRDQASVGKIYDGLRKMGADYVFDTSFSADLTIMEEAYEFLDRLESGQLDQKPMFTSCCPGWVRFVKSQYPNLVSNLSSAKSPMQMFGSTIKTYFAKKINKDPNDIVTVAIMPCVAKKSEANMDLYYEEYAGKDTDISLTTRELVRMFRQSHLDIRYLEDADQDRLMHDYSGAGVIFGASGGVMEAALRTAYFAIKGENPDPGLFMEVRNKNRDILEKTYNLDGKTLKVAVVNGLSNTRRLIYDINSGKSHYDFVEVMACPGGCVGGGGQPIHDGEEFDIERGAELYRLDEKKDLRYSHENEDIKKLYEDFFKKPNSNLAHMLLHTDHNSWVMPKQPRKNRNGYVISQKDL
ncbi:MAG: [FeFe] hydrogenase, group A [Anaerococcus sp.]|nr:[FeFe] hydrogenase, group A [Anaerococcus sp.]